MKLFISYRRADLFNQAPALVGRVFDRLISQFGRGNVFMDVDSIPYGEDFVEYLGARVAQADVLLAVIGPQWAEHMAARAGDEDDFVRIEIESALQRNIPVVPVLVGAANMPAAGELPPILRGLERRNAAVVDGGRDFNAHMTRLIAELAHLHPATSGFEQSTAAASHPVGHPVLRKMAAPLSQTRTKSGMHSHSEPRTAPEIPSRKGFPIPVLILVGVVMVVSLLALLPVWHGRSPRTPAVADVVEDVKTPSESTAPAPTSESTSSAPTFENPPLPKPTEQNYTNTLGMEMVWCPSGSFLMGSPKDDEQHRKDETQHSVTLTQGFWISRHETTQGQWEALMGANPSTFKEAGPKAPVETVSWDDCIEFCRKLTAEERKQAKLPADWEYTLPTEAQWEYACRADSTTPFSFGKVLNGTQANCDGTSPYGTQEEGPWLQKTTPVGSYPANPWGLYDMHGNVCERCLDWYGDYPNDPVTDPKGSAQGPGRVARGGSWYHAAGICRSADRYYDSVGSRSVNTGFRLVRSIVQSAGAAEQ